MESEKEGCKYQIVVTDEDGNPIESFPITSGMTKERINQRVWAISRRYPRVTVERRAY